MQRIIIIINSINFHGMEGYGINCGITFVFVYLFGYIGGHELRGLMGWGFYIVYVAISCGGLTPVHNWSIGQSHLTCSLMKFN